MSHDDPERNAGSLPALSVLADASRASSPVPAPPPTPPGRTEGAPSARHQTPAFPFESGGPDALATTEAERYERRQLLGKGGMGRVTVARDRRLDRDVALKEVSAGNEPLRAALESRLAREATVTARLEHPGIVAVYDAGKSADGTPFYTMRVVRGRSLHDALRSAPNATARLRFVRHVFDAANAVAWAHRHGVVHRDLKPANIMVGEFGETQVVDWGLAHVVGEPMSTSAVGTPGYMSPEQAAGQGSDARSDVWSLGAVLRDVVPTGSECPAELRAIIQRAMATDPAARYGDAKSFADDLGAWLDGRRVGAYSYSTWELFARLARAWRVPLTIAFASLVAIAIAIAIAFSETAAERDRAAAAEAETRVALARADQDLAKALLGAASERAAAGARPEAELLAAASLLKAESPGARGILALAAGEAAPVRISTQRIPACSELVPSHDATRALCKEPDALSLWDVGSDAPTWRRLGRIELSPVLLEDDGLVYVQESGGVAGNMLVLSALDGSPVDDAALCCGLQKSTPEGTSIVTATSFGLLVSRGKDAPYVGVWPHCVGMIPAWDETAERGAWLCPDGRFGIFEDHGVREGKLASAYTPEPSEALLIPGTRQLVVGTTEGEVLVVDLTDGTIRMRDDDGGVGLVSDLSLSVDHTLVALRDEERGVRLFDLRAGVYRQRLPSNLGRGARFIAGGPRRLVTWNRDELVTWDVPEAPPGMVPVADGVTGLDLDGAHQRLAIATAVGVEVLSLGDASRVLRIPSATVVKATAFSSDGARVGHVYAGPTTQVEVHDVTTGERVFETEIEEAFNRRMASLLGGRWLLAPAMGRLSIRDARGRLWWTESGTALRDTIDLAVARDRRTAFVLSGSGHDLARVDLGDVQATTSVANIASDRRWQGLASDAPGALVACAGEGGIAVLDRDGAPVRELVASPEARLDRVAWSADGKWLASGDLDGSVYVWNWRDGAAAAVARVRAHDERVGALLFDPAGRIITGGWDDRVRFIDLSTLEAPAAALLSTLESRWDMGWPNVVGQSR